MYTRVIALVGVAMCLALSAAAQNSVEKPFTMWSKDDALKLMSDSPWAKKIENTQPSESLSATPNSRATAANAPVEQGSGPGIPSIVIQIHSGLPLREAIARMQQIATGYDKKTDADKAAFDATQKAFLECTICNDYYVITISKSRSRDIPFGGLTTDDLRSKVKLVNDKGEEREIARFDAPQNVREAAVFYFKRTDDKGSPFVTVDSKEVRLVFSKEFLGKNPSASMVPASSSFKISKMIVGGKLLF
jgi:hypothetical protein